MRELKPKLIIADSGRRRRGPGGGLWSFLTFLIIFAAGVYVGTKLDDAGLLGGESASEVTTEAPRPEKAEVKDISPSSSSESSSLESRLENMKPFEQVVIVDAETGSQNPTPDGQTPPEPGLENIGNSDTVGVTSLNPEKISGESPDTPPGTALSPDTALPDSQTAVKSEPAQTTGKDRYTLQVGAFSSPDDARKAVNDYKSKGYNAYVVQVENSKGEQWNLVKIGKFGTIEQAWSQSAQFKRSEGVDAYVETLSQKTAVNESWSKPDSPSSQ